MFTTILALSIAGTVLLFFAIQHQAAAKKKAQQQKVILDRHVRTLKSLKSIENAPGIVCPLALRMVIANRRLACIRTLARAGLEDHLNGLSEADASRQAQNIRAELSENLEIEEIALPEGTTENQNAQQTLNRYMFFLKREAQLNDTSYSDTRRAIATVELAIYKAFLEESLSRGNAAIHAKMLGSARSYFENAVEKLQSRPEFIPPLSTLFEKVQQKYKETERLLTDSNGPVIPRLDNDSEYGLDRLMGGEKAHW